MPYLFKECRKMVRNFKHEMNNWQQPIVFLGNGLVFLHS